MSENLLVLPRVRFAQMVADYVLQVVFYDGVERTVDLSGELWGAMAQPLRDPAYFAQVRVDHELGTVCWPNGFDLDPDVLHGDHTPADQPPPAHADQPVAVR